MKPTNHMIVLRHGEVYDPTPLGTCDVLVGGNEILATGQGLPELPKALQVEEVDATGLKIIPGLIDAHVHVTGGGGESGYATRVPRAKLSEFTRAGITSVVGLLGADGTTRTVRDLVATTLGLREEGLSAWCYTGSYQIPVPTLTGSVRDDIVYVDPIIGVGEVAISDHRSSQPTLNEILRLASEAYTAGMISRKAGVVHFHLGDGERGLDLLRQALRTAEIPTRVYHPTHVNRQTRLFDESMELAALGVTVDVTAFPDADEGLLAEDAIDLWLKQNCPVEQITCSSDGAGCLPNFDKQGNMISMDVGRPSSLTQTLVALLNKGHPLENVLPIFTTNVARVMRLPGKGRLQPTAHADLVCLDHNNNVHHVLCGGKWMVRNGEPVQLGTFERKEQL